MAADYYSAAAAAVEVLQSVSSGSAATDIKLIINYDDGVRLIRYSQMCARIGGTVYKFATEYAESEHSYTKLDNTTGIYYIMYNDAVLDREWRSHLAHEYAHTLLGHHIGNGNNDEENEADCCARLVMCPASIADALDISSIDQYIRVFNVNDEMAKDALRFRTRDRETLDVMFPDLVERYGNRLMLSRGLLNRYKRASGSWIFDVYD